MLRTVAALFVLCCSFAAAGSWMFVGSGGGTPFANAKATQFTPASSQQINCGNVLDWTGGTAITIAAWGRLDVAAPSSTIVAKAVAGITGWDFFYNGNSINLYAPSAGGGGLLYVHGIVTPPDGATYHRYTLTSDGTKTAAGTKFYEDGVLLSNSVTTDTLSGSLSNSGNLLIGATIAALGPDRYSGLMDEVSIWDVALSAGEETALASGGKPVNLLAHSQAAHLIFWSRMGDSPDSTSSYVDASTGGHDCTPANIAGGDIVSTVP